MVVALRAAPGEFWDKPTPENFTVFKERCESIITRAEARFGVHHGFDAVRDWFRQLTNFMTQLFVRIGKCMRLLNHAYEPKLYAKPSTQAQLLWNENKNFKEELLGNSEAHTPGLLDNVADEVTQHNAEKPKP
jgi:hypothetical protein